MRVWVWQGRRTVETHSIVRLPFVRLTPKWDSNTHVYVKSETPFLDSLTHAGSGIKFARRKNLSIFLTLLKIRILRIFFKSCLWSGFINPPYIWTALFEKETYKKKPPRLKSSKMWRIRGTIRWTEFCLLFYETTGFTLKKSLRIRILREFGESRDFFCEQIWSCDRRQQQEQETMRSKDTDFIENW